MLLSFLRIKVEPYWNVNPRTGEINGVSYHIKVEPYWKVNYDKECDVCCICELK